MLFSTIASSLALAGSVSALPAALESRTDSGQKAFSFPLPNGFPNITPGSQQLKDIQKQAHGTLPNGPLPSKINDTSAIVWSLIAFNEIFEVAFFTDLIHNITTNVTGYTECNGYTREYILEALTAIQAQEELHALGANTILKTAGRPQVQPCKYKFPTSNLNDALAFAKTFTDLVVGTLQTALTSFGLDGDVAFLQLVGSVIGQESQQVAAIRIYEGLIPSALPFLTVGGPAFAYSALQQLVIVPGSCQASDASQIPIPVLAPLSVETKKITPRTTSLQFSFSNATLPNAADLSLVYINQQNLPIVESLQTVQTSGDKVTFTAAFPYEKNLLNSLTIASVVKGKGPFANSSDVAAAALFGPGLIEFN